MRFFSKVLILFLFLLALTQVSAQTVRVIDNKGTINDIYQYWTKIGSTGDIHNTNTGNVGIGTGATAPAATLHNAGSTILGSKELTSGSIDVATVNTYSGVVVKNNTTGTLPFDEPTDKTPGRIFQVSNSNTSASITVGGVTLAPGSSTLFRWDGSKWSPMTAATATNDWLLTGNSGISTPAVPATYGTTLLGSTENWIGTTDANDFVVGTQNIERLRFKSDGSIGIGTASTAANTLLTINPTTNNFRNGISLNLKGATANANAINISSDNSYVNGLSFINTSGTNANLWGTGAVLSNNNIVSGYTAYRNSSGFSFGLYGITGLNTAYAFNSNTWAAFLQGRVIISPDNINISNDNIAGVDLLIKNTTGNSNPTTLMFRHNSSLGSLGNVLANINFGDNYTNAPQAQIQAVRDATSTGSSDLPTALTFSTTPAGSATIKERMRISNAGNVGIGIANPAYKLDVAGDVNFTGALRLGGNAGASGQILQSTGSGAPNWVSPNSALTKASITSSTTGVTITGTNNVLSAGTIDIATASGTQQGLLSAANWDTFNSKEPAITAGTTAQYWRGDKTWQTLNTSVVPENTNLYYTDARARAAISLTTTGTSGVASYNSATGVLNIPNYADGGITSLNGLTGLTQTFAIGTSGTNPNWTSATSIHTLNIPMASASSVTAGLISNTEWNTFNNKIGAVTALTPAAVSTSGATATIQNTGAYWNANQLQGKNISTTPPTTGQILTYNSITSQWEPAANGGSGWLLTGNTGTDPTINFLGTKDDKALVIKVNGQPAGLIGSVNSFGGQTNLGYNASTGSQYSTAIGAYATANSSSGVALGYQSTASDQYTIAIGGTSSSTTEAKKTYATAIGSGAKATEQYTLALGGLAQAIAANATAIGYNTTADHTNTVILGNGANVGIGTTNPQNKLEITQGTAGNSGLRFTNLPNASLLGTNANGDVIVASSSIPNIYNTDGTLTNNRKLTQDGKTLTIETGGSALNITGLPASTTNTENVIAADATTGQVKTIVPAYAVKWFYLPQTPINTAFASYPSTQTLDLFPLIQQLQTAGIIPSGVISANMFNYKAISYDTSVFKNDLSIDASGKMTYTVLAPATDATFINLVAWFK